MGTVEAAKGRNAIALPHLQELKCRHCEVVVVRDDCVDRGALFPSVAVLTVLLRSVPRAQTRLQAHLMHCGFTVMSRDPSPRKCCLRSYHRLVQTHLLWSPLVHATNTAVICILTIADMTFRSQGSCSKFRKHAIKELCCGKNPKIYLCEVIKKWALSLYVQNTR